MDNTMVGRLAAARNPLNPKASNYNPSLQGQIDFLDGMTGTGITGTSDNLKFTDGLAMIGRDPNSGLGKYGPGSVLSGQNIVSGFGTNDYVGQLDKYIEKMMGYKTRSKFQQAKLDRAIAEKKAAQEKEMREELAREKARAQIERAKRRQAPSDPGDRGRDDTPGFGKTTQGNYTNQFEGGDPGLRADGGLMGRGGSRKKSYFKGGIVSLRGR